MPANYDGSKPLPLVISLHGYTQTGPEIQSYLNLDAKVDSKEFLYCIPEGTTDFSGAPFWNATDACCGFFSSVDDAGYLREIIELIQNDYAVDDRSIHITGLSNGGFMSYRMACEHSDLIASIVPIAGTTFQDDSDCLASDPVHVLHVHGTADSTVEYGGGCFLGCYPGAEESVQKWVDYNGCDVESQSGGAAFNMDWSVGGNETSSTIYQQNCDENVTVELWKMTGSEHVPNFRRNSDPVTDNLFATRALDWMLSHRKPGEPTCPSDVNGDSKIDTEDILDLLEAWGSSNSQADVDKNGIVNVMDLLILLGNFGDDC
jgi:polyhydroxybutyrate depolymerase